MRKPEKHLTQEDMWATLAKHSSIPVTNVTPQVGESPQAKLPPLQWEKPVKTGADAGYVLTKDGAFSVAKVCVKGAAMYTAHRRKTDHMSERLLGIRDHLNEAKHLCELDRK